MSTIAETLAANQVREFRIQADYLRVLTGSNIKVAFYRHGAVVQESSGVGAGYAIRFKQDFDRFDITDLSGASNDVSVLLGNGVTIDINSVSGSVSISGTASVQSAPVAYSQGAVTVGVASGVLAAANAARRFLLVQNNHASQNIWLNLAGAAATQAAGVKIPPAGSLLIDQACPTGAVYAIGETGNNTTVTVVEG